MLSILEKRCHINVFTARGSCFFRPDVFVALFFHKGNMKCTSCEKGFNLCFVFFYLQFIIQCTINFYFKILFIFGDVYSRVFKGFRIQKFDGYIMLFIFSFI